MGEEDENSRLPVQQHAWTCLINGTVKEELSKLFCFV